MAKKTSPLRAKRKPKPPVKVRASVRLDAYAIIRERVEVAAPAGVRRWLKHRDKPRLSDADVESLGERVADEVMLALGEVLAWHEVEP